jgi:hypothetical protein
LVLLLAADAPGSRRARANLGLALEATDRRNLPVDTVDVLRDPGAAIDFGILATPALLWASASEVRSVLYGDLSDRAAVERFLDGVSPHDEADA